MKIAIVGCGFVADYYLATLVNYPELHLAGVFDRDEERLARFAAFHGMSRFRSYEELLADRSVELVVNLTNPSSHHQVSLAALMAGKHVYSEKPLAMSFPEAEQLVALAESRGLRIVSAPCTVLGEAAQTMWKALRDGRIGTPRLVYAEMDDGPIPLLDHQSWASPAGAPWPSRDEFEVGCTLEHAGYYLTWLTAFFGPALRVSASSQVVMPDKGVALDRVSPDFSVAVIEFGRGVVARLTCSIFAPVDRRMRIFGDRGILSVRDCWDFGSPVSLLRRTPLSLRAERHPRLARMAGLGPRRVPLVRRPRFRWMGRPASHIDFARGIADLATSDPDQRRLSGRWSLHCNELALAIQDPGSGGSPRRLQSTFDTLMPAAWSA